jgi:hypothetical protein
MMQLNFDSLQKSVGYVGHESMPSTDRLTLLDKPGTKQDEPENVAANDAPLTSWRWRIELPNRPPLVVSFSPEATHAEVLALYPASVAAKPCGGCDGLAVGSEAIYGTLDKVCQDTGECADGFSHNDHHRRRQQRQCDGDNYRADGT